VETPTTTDIQDQEDHVDMGLTVVKDKARTSTKMAITRTRILTTIPMAMLSRDPKTKTVVTTVVSDLQEVITALSHLPDKLPIHPTSTVAAALELVEWLLTHAKQKWLTSCTSSSNRPCSCRRRP
jgi:hypothetical protein